uniref:Uncharacterized protein n=1 Tax=viral metagenome TaxID=1070528 RepID=A0A6H1ZFQ2_9ZZZZ
MSDDNLFTEAKDEALFFMNEVAGDVAKQFKGKNPYNQIKATKQEITNAYMSLGPESKMQLIGKYGRDAQDYFQEIEMEIGNAFI